VEAFPFMTGIILVFLVVFLLNVAPAFAPPTWMVFSFVGFRYPAQDKVPLALAGALAATMGRVVLAKMSRLIIRQKLLSQSTIENIDAIKERLEGRQKLTFSVFLLYAFTPLPSNYVFIAYGLTAMDLKLIAIPFFLGRSVSYSFWAVTASAVARKFSLEFSEGLSYLSLYFVVSQFLLLFAVYAFTRVDWRTLFREKKLKWIAAETKDAARLRNRS
jgi:hypothetical protein